MGDKRLRADTRIPSCTITCYPIALFLAYGLSLLGTSLRVYCGDKVAGEVTPHFVGRPNADRILPPDFLGGQWNLDILSPDGLTKMQVVAYIWRNPLMFCGVEVGTYF